MTLFCMARVVDRQVLLKTDLRDPYGERDCGVYVFPITPILGGPSRSSSSNATAVAMVPIATTMTLQKLTPAPGLGTAVPCTLSVPGCWAGPMICEIEMK